MVKGNIAAVIAANTRTNLGNVGVALVKAAQKAKA